jgi:hypothetical protein
VCLLQDQSRELAEQEMLARAIEQSFVEEAARADAQQRKYEVWIAC